METNWILWRRLDTPGHDACRLEKRGVGWQLEGSAIFRHEDGPACISYKVECDKYWQTRKAEVRGWVGAHSLDIRISRPPDGQWTVNDHTVSGLNKCIDLDLSVTPVTNLFQLRRFTLQRGQAANVPVAWLHIPCGSLDVLHQRYERRGVEEFWYEAPRAVS